MSQEIKVLIVEDLPTDAELCEREIRKVLEQCRFQRVDTRKEYLAAIDDFKPDIILSDFKLPAFDGMTALRLALEITPQTPFVMVTGSMNEDTAVECMRAGAWDYVIKEHIKRLGNVVLNMLEEKKLRHAKEQSDAALIQSEERYRRISSITSDITFSCISQQDNGYKIDWMSGAAESITGYTNDEIIQKSCWSFLVVEEDMHLFNENVTGLEPGQTGSCELRIIHKYGRKVWVSVRTECVQGEDNGSGKRLFGGLTDITDRKATEARINLDDIRLKELLELHRLEDKSEISILSHALVACTRSLQSPFAFIGLMDPGESVMTIHAWSQDAMEQCRVSGNPMHFPIAEAGLWGEVVRQRRPVIVNDYAATELLKKGYPDGHVPVNNFLSVPVMNGGKIVAVAAVSNKEEPYDELDVNALSVLLHETWELIYEKRSEDAVLRSKALLQNVIDSTPDWMYVKDQEHRYIMVNKSFAGAQGLAPQDMVGRPDTDFFSCELCYGNPEKDISGYHNDDMEAFAGRVVHNPRNIITWADGSRHVYDTYKIPLTERDGKIYGALVYSRDISERQKAEDELEDAFNKLQKTLIDFINTISKIVEMKDPYTAGHQKRVADLSSAIAGEMGLPSDQVKCIYIAGLIHDIGKIYIPSDILSKPGKLTDIEWQLIQTHPQGSYDILKTVEFPWPLADIALQHHERINGSGYPNGLSGDGIMLEAKILAVADVVEAMASHRPYRQSLGIGVALEEIRKNSGVLYDSRIVEICLQMFAGNKFEFK